MTPTPRPSMLATTACLLATTLVPAVVHAGDRPNVIVFVSDDHRADVLGCAGHPIVLTPHIDALAANGVRFADAFVTTSICAASRASILTGVVERTHGYTFGTPPLAARFSDQSYPARLRALGYRTGFVGKLGVSIAGGREVIDRLFDSFAPLGRNPYLKPRADGTTRHVTDLTGDAAIEFIRSTPGDTPFCLSVSFNAAHAEDGDTAHHYPAPATEASLYDGVPMPRPRLDDPAVFEGQPPFLRTSMNRDRWFWRWDTPEKYDRNLRDYFRMLTGLDRNVGRVMAELVAQGRADDTVVIFLGDNGYYMGERGFAGKWSHYEESLRVPFVIVDPRTPAAWRGRVASAIALNIDVTATVLDAAGQAEPEGYQGRSLLPFTRDVAVDDERSGFFCEHLMRHEDIPRWEGYRTRRFMYARYLGVAEGGELLYDLETDPHQLVNLVGVKEHRPTLRSMRQACREHADRFARQGAARPRVLLLGDSISMGYHQFVVDALLGEARVVRPDENCAGTTKGVGKIDEWLALDGGVFDVIHFNFGLHDLKRVKPDGRNSNDPADARQAELDAYEQNLRQIVARLRTTDATLVFATTTPFPPGVRPRRDPEDAARYNAAARRVMAEHGIAIDDLYGFAAPQIEAIQAPVNVHFTREGSKTLGTEVTRQVREALRTRGAP